MPRNSSAYHLNSPLDGILTESVEGVRARERTALPTLLQSANGRVVLYGAGTLGRRALGLLTSLGATVLAFSDNDPAKWGTRVEDIDVLSPEHMARQYGASAIVFVTIWNDHHWYHQTYARLSALGCRYISTFAPIFWHFPENFLTLRLLNEPPHRVYEDMDNVLAAERLWADDESLDCYRANITWRALGEALHLPGPPVAATYFPAELFELKEDDALLDCGAFDGDTVREALQLVPKGLIVHAIEADLISFQRLQSFIGSLPSAIASRIHPSQCAVGETRCTLRFECTGSLTSKAAGSGAEVPCIPVDEAFSDKRLTIIKMDIEGAEYGALLGARQLIRRDGPILAICVYHTQNDIWRIPLLIRDLLPQHKLYLRAYEGDGFQTVCYAVPPDRELT